MRFKTIVIISLLISLPSLCPGQKIADAAFQTGLSEPGSQHLFIYPNFLFFTRPDYHSQHHRTNDLWKSFVFDPNSKTPHILPEFVPLNYFWWPLWDEISITFQKGLIGGIIENGITENNFEPGLPLPFKFCLNIKYNTLSLLKMDLTQVK